MSPAQFATQDNCEYVYREKHYRRSRSFRHIRRKLRKLRMYIVILALSAGGGAAAVYIPEMLKNVGSELVGDKLELYQKYQKNKHLIEKYRQKHGSLPPGMPQGLPRR